MSTGKRLAKRSIIGTRVCAPGTDGLFYSGVIHSVRTPANAQENNNCINLTPNTKYSVRFDQKQDLGRRGLNREFRDTELIGPGFQSVMNVHLRPGQKVFLTFNGRESAGEVITHDNIKDEVNVRITPLGQEAHLELKKRLEEVRLLESRRSARLADQERDTDFARLADMAGDRRRASHSIDVPLGFAQQNNGSRKRRTSYSQDDIYNDDDPMDECNAALVLMSLSCSPHSPRTVVSQWHSVFGSSPGSTSGASWSSSGTSSPPLSDEGAPSSTNGRIRTTSLSTSDEGIVMDYNEEMPRKKRANGPLFKCVWKGCNVIHSTVSQIEAHIRNAHLGPKKPRQSLDDDGTFSDSDHEEEFYYTELEDEEDTAAPSPPSPPTLSHRDMARPPHEDPEYQRQIVGSFRQGFLSLQQTPVKPPLPIGHAGPISIPNAILPQHNYSWSHQQSPVSRSLPKASPQKHVRLSPRPSTSYAPYPSPTYTNAITAVQHNVNIYMPVNQGAVVAHNAPAAHRSPLSPNRRTRGENKKCRKVYGMEHKDQWCTQCKWKKACSRFGD
ncbi:zinc finger protein 395 isoform X1 [Phlebotomus argentipes]|uniref:zinc finger protein 395 isoform X1 n=1 Tax=Phlebotomus argentipes TaxID=94469 RepID=UPI002892AA24|nr:zinc finger protein 395 isoform X1 [Phlebotomus argentipes]